MGECCDEHPDRAIRDRHFRSKKVGRERTGYRRSIKKSRGKKGQTPEVSLEVCDNGGSSQNISIKKIYISLDTFRVQIQSTKFCLHQLLAGLSNRWEVVRSSKF